MLTGCLRPTLILNYFPFFKTSKLQRLFKYQGVKIWNKISKTLKYQLYSKFKKQFTNLLIDQYQYKDTKDKFTG